MYVVLGGAAHVPSARRKLLVPPPSLTRPAVVVDALWAYNVPIIRAGPVTIKSFNCAIGHHLPSYIS